MAGSRAICCHKDEASKSNSWTVMKNLYLTKPYSMTCIQNLACIYHIMVRRTPPFWTYYDYQHYHYHPLPVCGTGTGTGENHLKSYIYIYKLLHSWFIVDSYTWPNETLGKYIKYLALLLVLVGVAGPCRSGMAVWQVAKHLAAGCVGCCASVRSRQMIDLKYKSHIGLHRTFTRISLKMKGPLLTRLDWNKLQEEILHGDALLQRVWITGSVPELWTFANVHTLPPSNISYLNDGIS